MSRAREFADLAGSADAGGITGRNMVINGAMQIYQRGASTTSSGGFAADRFSHEYGGGTSTLSRETLSSGSPYDEGFRFFTRLTNTATASGSGNFRQLRTALESQDIANSGWNYKSATSFVTWSFWVRVSLAGKYTFTFQTADGTAYLYGFSETLVADTWTKVTQAIPGNANLQFDNDANVGLYVHARVWLGSDFTSASSENAWAAYNSANISTSGIANFAGTSNATFDMTGVQLEVGEQATPFEHRSFGDELARCQRYYFRQEYDSAIPYLGAGGVYRNTLAMLIMHLPVAMRVAPTAIDQSGTASHYTAWGNESTTACSAVPVIRAGDSKTSVNVDLTFNTLNSATGTYVYRITNTSGYLGVSAEL